MDKYKKRELKLKTLVGAKVNSVAIDASKEFLRLNTDRGDFTFVAVGECCSKSWIEHTCGAMNIIGGIITESPDLYPNGEEIPNGEADDEYSLTQRYITKFVTDKGWMELEFRNESNGYYSGCLKFEAGQYGNDVEYPELTILTKDI